MNKTLERVVKEANVECFKILFQHLPARAEKKHKKSQSEKTGKEIRLQNNEKSLKNKYIKIV
jgi:hypothetical protein